MPKPFKKVITRYLNADGRQVPKGTPGARKVKEKSAAYYGRYKDADGKRVEVKLCAEKQTSQQVLNELQNNVLKGKAGLIDAYEQHKRQPLAEHLEDYRLDLLADGDSPDYVEPAVRRVRRVLESCGFRFYRDVQATAVNRFLKSLRDGADAAATDPAKEWYTVKEAALLLGVQLDSVHRMVKRRQLACEGAGRKKQVPRADLERLIAGRARGVGVVTSNNYLTAVKGFFTWMKANRRAGENPLEQMETLNADVDLRHQRRALTTVEFDRLVEATAAGKPFRYLSGVDRLVLYVFAANTGFRAEELGSLTPRSFHLDDVPPTATLQAADTKNRQKAVQVLRADVAEVMRGHLNGKAADAPVWPGTWTEAGAEMVRMDLDAAGIPYADAEDRVFDFHALRVQFISFLAAAGANVKVAQTLARHSDIRLTLDVYTKKDVFDVTQGLDLMPPLPKSARPALRIVAADEPDAPVSVAQ